MHYQLIELFVNGRFHSAWLRHNCQCSECQQEHSGQRLYDPADIPANIVVNDASISGKADFYLPLFNIQIYFQMKKKCLFQIIRPIWSEPISDFHDIWQTGGSHQPRTGRQSMTGKLPK